MIREFDIKESTSLVRQYDADAEAVLVDGKLDILKVHRDLNVKQIPTLSVREVVLIGEIYNQMKRAGEI